MKCYVYNLFRQHSKLQTNISQYFELCFSLYYFAENNPIIITIDKSIMVVLELIMVIFAILQIILFFKLWRMADNVNEIVRKMRFPYNKSESSYPESYSKFLFLLYNKSKGDAKEYLLKVMWGSRDMNSLVSCSKVKDFETYYHYLQLKYQSWFDKLGEEFPSFDNLKKEKK